MTVRETRPEDLDGLLCLYMRLHNNPFPEKTEELPALWDRMEKDPDHPVIVAEAEGKIVSSCVCVVIPNLTHGQRPYALVENVVTDAEYRRRGRATACPDYARALADRKNCYKMMLLTGSANNPQHLPALPRGSAGRFCR